MTRQLPNKRNGDKAVQGHKTQHLRDELMHVNKTRTAEVTVCIIPDRTARSPSTVTEFPSLDALEYHGVHGSSLRLQQKLREEACADPGPRQCPHPPHRGHPGRRGGMACQPCPRQLTWLQRASRQPQGQGGRERKEALVSEMRWQRMVRAMKCGGAPTQPTYNHHPTLMPVLHFFVHRQTECIPACDLTCYFSRFTYCCFSM